MAKNAFDIWIETLLDGGVEVFVGLPDNGIDGILEVLRKRKDKIKFLKASQEDAATVALDKFRELI
jgi:pyruvate dehydrogenase (quinone)